jgi:hypothetical protein
MGQLAHPAVLAGVDTSGDLWHVDRKALETLLSSLGLPRADLDAIVPLIAGSELDTVPFELRVGDWVIDLKSALARALINGVTLTSALAAMHQASIPATVLSVIVPLLFDVQHVQVSPADKYVYAVLLDAPASGETIEGWYARLPARVRGEMTELEFRNTIGRLTEAGLVEGDDAGSMLVPPPSPRRLVRLELPTVPTQEERLLDSTLGPGRPLPAAVMRRSHAFDLDETIVASCLNPESPADCLFARGWRSGPASLTRSERNMIAGVIGHIAESVTEIVLDALGWRVLWHFPGPGRHGVDLVFVTPDNKVVAVEVKGTLVANRIPRLSRREVAQMSAAWIDKADNPGMTELAASSEDIYGAVAAVNFADMNWRVALTSDFTVLFPVTRIGQLTDLGWAAL